MTIFWTVCLCLALGFIHPVSMSFSTTYKDTDGSGYDLDSSGSGSGDWSEQAGEIKDIKVRLNSQDPTFGSTQSPAYDSESGFIVVDNSRSIFENKQIFTGVIAGGLTGGILAAILTVVLIYKWHKKDDEGYILGQQTHREQIVV